MQHPVIIFNPETGTIVRVVDMPALAPGFIADMQAQGQRVAPLATEPFDRTWSARWSASLLESRDYQGKHRRPVETTRPHPTQPTIVGVR